MATNSQSWSEHWKYVGGHTYTTKELSSKVLKIETYYMNTTKCAVIYEKCSYPFNKKIWVKKFKNENLAVQFARAWMSKHK